MFLFGFLFLGYVREGVCRRHLFSSLGGPLDNMAEISTGHCEGILYETVGRLSSTTALHFSANGSL